MQWLPILVIGLAVANASSWGNPQEPQIEWTTKEIASASGQRYLARTRQIRQSAMSDWQVQIADFQNPDSVLLSTNFISLGGAGSEVIEVADVRRTGDLLGFLIRRHQPTIGNPNAQYVYGLATNEVATMASKHGFRHLPVGNGWTQVVLWWLDDARIEERAGPEFRLLDATTLEVVRAGRNSPETLKFEFSIDQAKLNGEFWKNKAPASASVPVLFKFEDARKFLLNVINLEVPTKTHYNERPYGEFIERHFSGLEQVREFFRPYAKDEAELSEFIQKLKAVQQAEIANVREFVRAYEERIKAGPPKPTPEEVEAERQRKLAEVEWRKKFDAEQEAKWQRHLQERRQKREELRKLREQMENDAE
jgi:hypothetical protein